MVLRQGMGESLWSDYEIYDQEQTDSQADRNNINSKKNSYLEQIKTSCVVAKNANRLFQLPISWKNNLFPVNSIPQFSLPSNMASQGVQLGTVEGVIKDRPFYLEPESLQQHFYLVGKTGTGKSTVLGSVINSLIERNEQAVFLLDPHGDLAQEILTTVSEKDLKQ